MQILLKQIVQIPLTILEQDLRESKGEKGEQGIPGTNGADGKTSYLHIKYSNDGGVTFTGNNGEDPGA